MRLLAFIWLLWAGALPPNLPEAVNKYLLLAHGLQATTYGYGEWRCGNIGKPRPCSKGAVTATGDTFDPELATAAISAPLSFYLTARNIYVKIGKNGTCGKVRLNDKMNPRYIGERGFDLTPGALRVLGVEPRASWSGRVFLCKPTLTKLLHDKGNQ